jgi:ribonuclease HI
MKLFFDGGCRPNPGEMEAGVVAAGRFHHRPGLGYGSSEEAEWLALLEALSVARRLGLDEIVLLGDAAAVVAQANGRLRLRNPAFQPLLARFGEEAVRFRRVRLRHIRRTQNLAGIALQRAQSERRGSR